MVKLVVEVVDARDLMPKDGQGSASPYVEVEFNGQRQRTHTKPRDLNPTWNQKLFFDLDPSGGSSSNHDDVLLRLHHHTIDVIVYNHGPHKNNFLGRVKISGHSVPFSECEASVQRYPLDKRGLFSHIRGDISLRMYLIIHHDNNDVDHGIGSSSSFPPPTAAAAATDTATTLLQDHMDRLNGGTKRDTDDGGHIHMHADEEDDNHRTISSNSSNRHYHHHHEENNNINEEEIKDKVREKEVKTFHSIGASSGSGGGDPPAVAGPSPSPAAPPLQFDAHFMKAAAPGPASVVRMEVPRPQNPEFSLVETRPPVAAHLRYRGGDKTTSTYDLVEQMHFLYVSVVKAKDLPNMDVSGSLDPYVEVRVGNYKGITKHLEKNQNPVWNQIFAFSKESLQSSFLEVIVKDKDLVSKDDFVGKVTFDVNEVPLRVPPDSPLAPQWYKLKNKKGESTTNMKGEIMLAVWMGTQADESFPEAWHSDAHSVVHTNLSNTRSKVYFSPKLYYLRAHVIEAQDLIPQEKGRAPDTYVKVVLGGQGRVTRPSQMKTTNPIWNEELMFVASEPFEDYIIVSVLDRVGPGKDEPLGRLMIPVRDVPLRAETAKLPDARWFNLLKPTPLVEEEEKKRDVKFASKICLRLCLDAGYHVLDESTHFSSDLRPSSKHLRKASIGILELGILSARNLLPMKSKEGRTTDAYCVAKYGNKWVRTRTLLDTLTPRWNEQYTWEVYDPCTVITIGVFDNCHVNGADDSRDQRIGKVRIRLSTLEIDRVYTHYYPLLILQSSGLKKNGELQLALRFTCTAWVNMVAQYGRPLLPKMHYIHPIPVRYIDWLRHQAMQIVAARLTRAEPPLRREVVEYMLDVDYHMFSLRRSKANFHRIMSLLSGVTVVCRWFDDICQWKNPVTTCLVHVLFLILVCYPELILPTIFLYLFVIGIWNYRFRPRHPPHMDARLSQAEFAHPDELDEEFDTFPTTRPTDIVRMRYDRLRSVGGRVQTVIGDLATQGERTQAILSWRDPRATAIFIIFSLISAIFIYITPPQLMAVLLGLYWLRHPRFRRKLPSVPVNFFKRLPAKSDMLL